MKLCLGGYYALIAVSELWISKAYFPLATIAVFYPPSPALLARLLGETHKQLQWNRSGKAPWQNAAI